MINIELDEFVNGFSLRGYDVKDGYFLNEVHEERIDALKAILAWSREEITKELEARQQNAGHL